MGDRLLRSASGAGARRRFKEPSTRHLDHCLAIVDVYISAVQLRAAEQLEQLEVATEPDCWQRFLGPGGVPEILKPDLALVTATAEFEDHWFIEVDRATESLPTLDSKCAQYLRYRRTGRLQADLGLFPLVLWVVPDEARAAALASHWQRLPDEDAVVFRVVTSDQVAGALIRGAS